jgi:hypothetical protein
MGTLREASTASVGVNSTALCVARPTPSAAALGMNVTETHPLQSDWTALKVVSEVMKLAVVTTADKGGLKGVNSSTGMEKV